MAAMMQVTRSANNVKERKIRVPNSVLVKWPEHTERQTS